MNLAIGFKELLEWDRSPAEQLNASNIGEEHYGKNRAALKQWICDPSGATQIFALDAVSGFANGFKGVSKAPTPGLAPALASLNNKKKRLDDIAKKADKANESSLKLRREGCEKQVDDLFTTPFAVRVGQTQKDKGPNAMGMLSVTAGLDAIVAIYNAISATVGQFEREARADAIKAYVKANEERIEKALQMMEGTDNSGQATKDKFTLQESIDDRMRYLLISTMLEVKEVKSLGSGDTFAKRAAAERASSAIREIEGLMPLDANEDLLKPLASVHRKFIAAVQNPNPSVDDLMTALADLRGARDKWITARDAWRTFRGGS